MTKKFGHRLFIVCPSEKTFSRKPFINLKINSHNLDRVTSWQVDQGYSINVLIDLCDELL
ncbi:hypothetical protein B6N60_04212 [Richelia sinica FACHB-800]|uniref:Uncharacterized protein n=1 Tax=Richelia sinica FACHB-800 TaxID=1357546 RepID=A0A975Y6P5_9NOST|nr:hypothetical protein [Richelia sinica]MBD2666412.1 hypothetical protein [Richelia sinica FACHB-800]QXE25497.1 hypothetical protein B6N60_04212 [Richelia sinica FACHB-800]